MGCSERSGDYYNWKEECFHLQNTLKRDLSKSLKGKTPFSRRTLASSTTLAVSYECA